MLLLWVTLLQLCQGYALVPVVTVQLGDPVTLTCAVPEIFQSVTWLHWYKQRAGETLKLIMMYQQNIQSKFEAEFPASRFSATVDEKISKLTIQRTVQQDEGIYHCAHMDWTKATWSGSYLSIKGNTESTSSYTVVSDPAHPADSETLQCSVLSAYEDESCSGGPSVFWFRAQSENSYPDMLYTDRSKPHNCEKTSDTQRECSFNFTKKISSSDAGTYYCAVATCGQIFIGNRKKELDAKDSSLWSPVSPVSFVLSSVLVISLIVIVILTCSVHKRKCDYCQAAVELHENCGPEKRENCEETWMYSAVVFSVMKTEDRTVKAAAAESRRIYAALKASGFY